MTPWTANQPIAKATTFTGHHNIEKHGHTSMPREGFEPTIPKFERLKTVRALRLRGYWDRQIINYPDIFTSKSRTTTSLNRKMGNTFG